MIRWRSSHLATLDHISGEGPDINLLPTRVAHDIELAMTTRSLRREWTASDDRLPLPSADDDHDDKPVGGGYLRPRVGLCAPSSQLASA